MSKKVYFTTPIYYANGSAHAGHIYATILGNILKRHHLQRGHCVKYLTGLDEHGEAVEQKALELKLTPKELVDKMAKTWKADFTNFAIDYDIFQRTTSEDHIKNVQGILSYCYKKGDIYFGEHEGYYCIKCESYLTESDMNENKECLIHKRPTELRKEGNYFFRTTQYKEKIKELILGNHITQQERYKKELLGLLESLTGDLSISRPKSRLSWGVELPFDSEHVTYVWFDALPNYLTGLGGLEASRKSEYWKNATHIIGKDILKFHGIFWQAICLSLELPTPKLLITGWILKDGHKMSKSLGNVVSTRDILDSGLDAFTNFVYRVTPLGEDIDFSWESYLEYYNSFLANSVGNLTSRLLVMIEKYTEAKIPTLIKETLNFEQKSILSNCEKSLSYYLECFKSYRIHDVLEGLSKLVASMDKMITDAKPWELFKNLEENKVQLESLLALGILVLKTVGYLYYPFFPLKMKELLTAIGESDTEPYLLDDLKALQIASGFKITNTPKLFLRKDLNKELKKYEKQKDSKSIKERELSRTQSSLIDIQDFSKVDLRVGLVIFAESVPDSDKLIKLKVSIGDEKKTIFSGLRPSLKAEDIIDKKVLIVNNLKARKLPFGVSEAMLLSVEDDKGRLKVIAVSDDIQEGLKLS
jgi:methionyl-tRNA synthetase